MSAFEQYIRYLQEICDGTRAAPAGLCVPEGTPVERALALQEQIEQLGTAEFVRLCAAQDDSASADDMPLPASGESSRLQIEEPDGPRSACEVLLDCCLLSDALFSYLMETLKTGDGLGFFKLSQVTTHTALRPEEFLQWLGTKEQFAGAEEQSCVAVMDSVLIRLAEQKQTELLAALLSGDRTTFERYRCDAPELRHLPQATYEWYDKNYLSRYYPIRLMMLLHGVPFPGKSAGSAVGSETAAASGGVPCDRT